MPARREGARATGGCVTGEPKASVLSTAEQTRRWHFAGAVLDELTQELLVGGVEVEIERRPLEALVHLLEHAGEVVTKDELLAAVWPGRILSDTVLTKCIGRLRDALGDDDQAIIKTVYGYGYRLMAPVRVELLRAPERVHFAFSAGDHPPGRPLWSLLHRLGAGGHGEAWLGQHDKTREQRVFKFAIDEASLTALKREITLFRFLNDSLGERARIVPLIDWNLDQPPCFIESEYIAGGSLIDWAERSGGLAKIPLATRIEVAAQIAEALASVHSVGVLHKDLKPSNILVDTSGGGKPNIRLADFGSGGVLDAKQLEALGITRMGFTKTVAAINATSGTPLYLAPELLAGQPPTVQADIYALGVMLYQLVIGEFRKAMSAGWERDVGDELLRADIAQAAEGEYTRRLADASELLQRLRSLEARRVSLLETRSAQQRAEEAQRSLDRARARRLGLLLAFGVLIVGLSVSTALYFRARSAQERALVAASQSDAVAQFLSQDVFSPVSSGAESVKNISVVEMLNRAGEQVDKRFAAQPAIASKLHYIIGRSMDEFYQTPAALRHYGRALEMGSQLEGSGSESATLSAAEMIELDWAVGNLRQTLTRYQEALRLASARLDPQNPALLKLRLSLAKGEYRLGYWTEARDALQKLLADVRASKDIAPEVVGRVEYAFGNALIEVSQPSDAVTHLRLAVVLLTAALGEKHAAVAAARTGLGRALIDVGQYKDARAELDSAVELANSWALPIADMIDRPRVNLGLLALEENQLTEAAQKLGRFVGDQDLNRPAYVQAHINEVIEVDHTARERQVLGEVLGRQGKTGEAIDTLRTALAVADLADDGAHPVTRSIRLSLAEQLMVQGRDAEAGAVLGQAGSTAFDDLPAVHPYQAQMHRVMGLVALRRGDRAAARAELERSLSIEQRLHPANHWRVIRVRRELLGLNR